MDFVFGLMTGFIVTVSLIFISIDSDKSDCELTLPRTEKCVMIFVPEKDLK